MHVPIPTWRNPPSAPTPSYLGIVAVAPTCLKRSPVSPITSSSPTTHSGTPPPAMGLPPSPPRAVLAHPSFRPGGLRALDAVPSPSWKPPPALASWFLALFCGLLGLPLEKEMAAHSSVLAWRIPGTAEPGGLPSMGSHRVGHDWSDLAAAAGLPWWLSGKGSSCSAGDTDSIPGSGRSPGGGMATHSSILAWEISRTEEPGRPQSMGSQRVGHDLATKEQQSSLARDRIRVPAVKVLSLNHWMAREFLAILLLSAWLGPLRPPFPGP